MTHLCATSPTSSSEDPYSSTSPRALDPCSTIDGGGSGSKKPTNLTCDANATSNAFAQTFATMFLSVSMSFGVDTLSIWPQISLLTTICKIRSLFDLEEVDICPRKWIYD